MLQWGATSKRFNLPSEVHPVCLFIVCALREDEEDRTKEEEFEEDGKHRREEM